MSLKRRNLQTSKNFSMPISYRLSDTDGLIDAQNVFDNKGTTETRYGVKRYNTTSLGGAPLSISFFKKNDGTRYKIVKVGTTLYKVAQVGSHTAIKTGLTSTTKHRGVTMGNRHIIAIEGDGLYSYDGTTFTQLGQQAPTAITVALATSGSLTIATWQVAISFYSSTLGFETNTYASAQLTTTSGNQTISITGMPSTASNAFIDKIRIYARNVTSAGAYYFVQEVSLGITTATISTVPTSLITPQTLNDQPIAGGGKFLAVFGKKLAYAGNSTYGSDVYLSNNYLPDAYDSTSSQIILKIEGQGPITGIATGFYSTSFLSPYLAIFKKNSVTLYSELYGIPNQVLLDKSVGCVSHDTIQVRNGNIYFLSENGWYMIDNGTIQKTEKDLPISLGGGAVDDIFSRQNWSLQLTAQNYTNFFSAFYSTLNQYITFINDGTTSTFNKAYVFEERIGGFRTFKFKTSFSCACEGEDDNGYQCVWLADTTGTIFTYSVLNPRHDEDVNGSSQTIPSYIILPYIIPGDYSCSYNFRDLIVRAIGGGSTVQVHSIPYFSLSSFDLFSFDFMNAQQGFTLDSSKLDIGTLPDERVPATAVLDINRTGEVLVVGFYQDVLDANIGLISGQLLYNMNGNRNF